MTNPASLVSLLGNVSSFASSRAYLDIPSNLHVFHKYYLKHYAYTYTEEYSFKNKIWIFDGREDVHSGKLSWLFPDLNSEHKRNITSYYKNYRYDHLDRDFVDWSKNSGGDTLKDILRVDLGEEKPLFSPITKKIYLNYSYAHSNFIPEYAFYLDGRTDANHYYNITFGKHKENPRKLNKAIFSSSAESTCRDLREQYASSQHFFSEEEGYDGICDRINMHYYNWSFLDKDSDQIKKWITPYAAYKYFFKDGWNEQYYYYALGDFVDSKGRSQNLFRSPTSDAWLVNYDDVFSLYMEGNSLKITLNESSEIVKKLNLSQTTDNQNLLNFLNISSHLKFSLSFNYLGKKIVNEFTIKDVLENKTILELQDKSHDFFGGFILHAKPANDSIVVFGGESQKYQYRVHYDSLVKANSVFDDLVFDNVNYRNMYPSELLESDNFFKHFQLVSKDKSIKSKLIDPGLLNLIDIKGEANDSSGTLEFSYMFNGETRSISLSGMKKIPELSGRIDAPDIDGVITQLKSRYPETSNHFWKHLEFKYQNNSNRHLRARFEPSVNESYAQKINFMDKRDFYDLKIEISNSKDLFPVAKTGHVEYGQLKDLFDLTDYAHSLNLSKEDYNYTLIRDDGRFLKVLVYLDDVRSVLGHFDNEVHYQKIYTFDKNQLKSSASNDLGLKEKEGGLVSWLTDPENIVITGSGTILSGSAGLGILKKFGWLKGKII